MSPSSQLTSSGVPRRRQRHFNSSWPRTKRGVHIGPPASLVSDESPLNGDHKMGGTSCGFLFVFHRLTATYEEVRYNFFSLDGTDEQRFLHPLTDVSARSRARSPLNVMSNKVEHTGDKGWEDRSRGSKEAVELRAILIKSYAGFGDIRHSRWLWQDVLVTTMALSVPVSQDLSLIRLVVYTLSSLNE